MQTSALNRTDWLALTPRTLASELCPSNDDPYSRVGRDGILNRATYT